MNTCVSTFHDSSSSSVVSSPSRYLTVVDVYDLAESINRDFECLAERFGKDCIENIVRKVICVLETLEALAKNNDSDNAEIIELQRTVEHLQNEKLQRVHEKENLEKDVADLEEHYKKEIDELCRLVKSLQSENKKVKHQLNETLSSCDSSRSMSPEQGSHIICEDEFQMMLDLRNVSMKQKAQIKELQRDIEHYNCEVENLQNNVETLIRQNKELLRKNSSLQKQGRMLLHERADLLRRLENAEVTNFRLNQLLSEKSRACQDFESQQEYERKAGTNSPRFTLEELQEVLHEKTVLKARVLELEEQLDASRGPTANSGSSLGTAENEMENLNLSCASGGGDSSCGNVEMTSAGGRRLPDEQRRRRVRRWKCPPEQLPFSVPRPFTADEVAVEAIALNESSFTSSSAVTPKTEKSGNLPDPKLTRSENGTEECEVYGPIYREPDEKLNPLKYQRKHSGVRKFFRFFKESLAGGGNWSPRRPSSSGAVAEKPSEAVK